MKIIYRMLALMLPLTLIGRRPRSRLEPGTIPRNESATKEPKEAGG